MSALGQKRTWQRILLMSALPPKADIGTQSWSVRFVLKADMRRFLLTAYARQRHARNARRVPFPGERLRPWGIEPHDQVERGFWGGKPVRFLVSAGTFVLETQIERSVRIVLERHPTTDSKPIEGIWNLEALIVIDGD